MTATTIRPEGWAPTVHGGDHAQLRTGATQILTVGAQGPFDAAGRLLHHEDPLAQAALALSNVASVLDAAGLGLADLALVQVHVVTSGRMADVVEAIVEHLAAAGSTPPLTVAAVDALLTPGAAVQIDALAVR